MQCEYFGKCASCNLFDKTYKEQLSFKIQREENRFKELTNIKFDIIKSKEGHFRNRAEFRVVKDFTNNQISYAMNDYDKNILKINSCKMVNESIYNLMPILLQKLQEEDILNHKLFSIEFLSSSINDTLVTLIYHKKLDDIWQQLATTLQNELKIKIIGRSKKQKIVLSSDFIEEKLNIAKQTFIFNYKENGFTQPNTNVNIKMIEWVLQNISSTNSDLCELYCGGGNFTIPLSKRFSKVLATEISKTSIKSALNNCELNNISNISFIRMSAQEFVEALNKVREFNRLKDINLDDYNFSTIFLDPPRAGLDDTTRTLATNFENIIYISCNPQTLHRDLQSLTKTHKITNFGLFDQFAYTNHIESGVILKKV